MIGKNRIQKPRRVLVVDDQEINRDILGVILEDYYEVEYAADGADTHTEEQQGILAAEHPEADIPVSSDKFLGQGHVTGSVFHADDVIHIMGQHFHQIRCQGISHATRIIVKQNRGFGHCLGNAPEMPVQLLPGRL